MNGFYYFCFMKNSMEESWKGNLEKILNKFAILWKEDSKKLVQVVS